MVEFVTSDNCDTGLYEMKKQKKYDKGKKNERKHKGQWKGKYPMIQTGVSIETGVDSPWHIIIQRTGSQTRHFGKDE